MQNKIFNLIYLFRNQTKPFVWFFGVLMLLLVAPSVHAQEVKTRILFVLDASGSMDSKWKGVTKFDIARKLLYEAIHEVEDSTGTVEFGMRVFGHQFHRTDSSCTDSKLEVPFSSPNATKTKLLLDSVQVQGQTPLAYSLFQSVGDFPFQRGVKNLIVLITDGLETCDGDPCALSPLLSRRNIAFKPFVIGLGLGKEGAEFFDCVGTYYDASNAKEFQLALDVVMAQALNNTSAQLNLLDKAGLPLETDVEFTITDEDSKEIRQSYVHTLTRTNVPDTIIVSPIGQYSITVHTTPEIHIPNIQFLPGIHNTITTPAVQGDLLLKINGKTGFSPAKAIIRANGRDSILHVQYLNTNHRYLVGTYDIEILTLPAIYKKGVVIKANKKSTISVPSNGALSVTFLRKGVFSILQKLEGDFKMIYELKQVDKQQTLKLLPGQYVAVYRPFEFNSSKLTQEQPFNVISNKNVNLSF